MPKRIEGRQMRPKVKKSAIELNEDEKPIEYEAVSRGISVCKVRMPRGLRLKNALTIAAEAKRIKANLIHTHGYKDTIHLGLLPFRFLKLPIIRTFHGTISSTRMSKIWLYEQLDMFCLKRINRE